MEMMLLELVCNNKVFDSRGCRFHGYAYDGIWAIARAIEAVEIDSRLENESLAQFQYK